MLTWLLPLNTGLSWSSALIMTLFFLSCRPRLLMYAQSFFVSSGRDSGCQPTMAESLSSGWSGFMTAGFGLRLEVFLVFGMDAHYRIACGRARLILSYTANFYCPSF